MAAVYLLRMCHSGVHLRMSIHHLYPDKTITQGEFDFECLSTSLSVVAPSQGYEYIRLVVFRIHEACLVVFENSEIYGACTCQDIAPQLRQLTRC